MKIFTTAFPFFLLILFSLSINAQSLLEAAGGIKTDFAFTTKDEDMGVESQILIRRSMEGTYNGMGQAYAYNAEFFFLELMSTKGIATQKINRKTTIFYLLKFYDANDQLIAEYKRNKNQLKVKSNEQEDAKFYITSISLRNIPLVFLEKTQRVEVIKHSIWN